MFHVVLLYTFITVLFFSLLGRLSILRISLFVLALVTVLFVLLCILNVVRELNLIIIEIPSTNELVLAASAGVW